MALSTKLANLKNVLKRRPLLFNSIIYGSFYTGAEFAQQSYNRKYQKVKLTRIPYDWTIMARYALLGTLVYSPIYYHWYKWLDRIFRGTTMRIVIVKLVADQFILTPPLLVLFFVSMSWMEGRKDIIHECKVKFVKTFQTSCMYWIPVQFVNFLLVPPALRVLYVSVAAFCWVNILCYLKRLPISTENVQADN